MKITPAVQMALHLHNAGVANARADYYAHPLEFNQRMYCPLCVRVRRAENHCELCTNALAKRRAAARRAVA